MEQVFRFAMNASAVVSHKDPNNIYGA